MRSHHISLRRGTAALCVAAVSAGVALGATGSAAAAPNTGGGDPNKKGCVDAEGNTHSHGATLRTYIRAGKRWRIAYVYRCNNGRWESVAAAAHSAPSGATSSAVASRLAD